MIIMVCQGIFFQGFDPECHGGGARREVGLGGEGQPLHGPHLDSFDMVSLEIIFIMIIDVELVPLDQVLSGLIIYR